MALIIPHYTTPQGTEQENAYLRVDPGSVRLLSKTQILFYYWIMPGPHNTPWDYRSDMCSYELDGASPIAQAYEYLQTLPEFAEAVEA